MTLKQSQKSNVIKVTTPTSKMPITEIKQVTEDASAWPTLNGAKQSNGLAYCDGSTLTNTDNIYDDFESANGSLVLPNGPFRTNEITLSIATSPSPPTGWNLKKATGVCYSDTEGNWRLKFNIVGTVTSMTTGSIYLDDIVFDSTADNYQALSVVSAGNIAVRGGAVYPGTNRIEIKLETSQTGFYVSGDVLLDSKPTITSFEDNYESYPVVSLFNNAGANVLGIPAADDTNAGTLTYYQTDIVTLDNEFTGGTRGLTITRIADTVFITGQGIPTHSANSTPESSSGLIPSWARPSVNIENVYAIEAGRINAVLVETDGTISGNYRTYAGAASNAGSSGQPFNITYVIT